MVLTFLAIILKIEKQIKLKITFYRKAYGYTDQDFLEDTKPLENLWFHLKVYLVFATFVLWYTIHSQIIGGMFDDV